MGGILSPIISFFYFMKYFSTLLFLLALSVSTVFSQSRNIELSIHVSSVEGDHLNGQAITLIQSDYQVSYGNLTLDASGDCTLKVYSGNHQLIIKRDGFLPISHDFLVSEGQQHQDINITLEENTRTPYALTANVNHDVFNGTNSIHLTWNREQPAFFDDFESYSPFAVTFGQWTGIDADLEAAAPLIGNYPNRGVFQYAQIINPLTVTPTWWYDYPILHPYEGKQYVGFTRTNSGNANDDWLISPVITVGTDNVLQFMGKAADQYPERFMVYVTEKLDDPTTADFVRIDHDNYETADYRGWKEYTYDLSSYAGRKIKFAIRYIGNYNQYGSFMLMIDNVYVGQQSAEVTTNPNEHFNIYLDGKIATKTADFECTLQNIPAGKHVIGIEAAYIKAVSPMVTTEVDIPADNYAHITFNVTANSLLSADGQEISITSLATSETYQVTVVNGQAEIASLPIGSYAIQIAEGAFNEYQQTIEVNANATINIELSDHILNPYNITSSIGEDGLYSLRWNQELIFKDSFEEYDDFATGKFGEWTSIDLDGQPVYPIGLGSTTNIVSFPGSGTADTPMPIAPMVFNPWKTTPAMLPTDNAIKAPTGDKTVIFFSPQRVQADKWLISPLLEIHENYVLSVTAKGYASMYPESMEFCISSGSDKPADFVAISHVDPIASEAWNIYQTPLTAYVGTKVRLAIHYTSTDAFLAQVDDFTVGPENGEGVAVDYGNVIRYDIYLDGQKIGESVKSEFTLPRLSSGTHTIGIKAIYKNTESETVEYIIDTEAASIATLQAQSTNEGQAVYSLSGTRLGNNMNGLPHGIYLIRKNGNTLKIRK